LVGSQATIVEICEKCPPSKSGDPYEKRGARKSEKTRNLKKRKPAKRSQHQQQPAPAAASTSSSQHQQRQQQCAAVKPLQSSPGRLA